MLVRDIMTKDVFTVSLDRNLNYVEIATELKSIRHVPVTDNDGKLCGIISIRDLLAHLSVGGASHFVPIKDVMQSQVITTKPDAHVTEVAEQMNKYSISALPVLEGERMIGIVSDRDFLKLAKHVS